MKTKIIYREPIGNPDRKYRQDRFIISSCMSTASGFGEDESDIRECIRQIKELECNLTEFIWADKEMTEKCVLACEEHGIDGIFQNWNAFGGFQARAGEMKMNREEFDKFMEFNKNYKHFYGYYVWDEPLSDEAVDATAEQLNQIEALDPKRLPFTVAIPSYNATDTWDNGLFEKYLIRYAKVVNPSVMSLDYYPFSALRPEPDNQLDDKHLFLDIALMRELSLKMKTPMWFYIQTQDMPMGEQYFRFTPARMTMQAYNVLLHGGKGIQYYCTVDGAIYRDGRRGPLFFQMKEMNRRITQWGKTLMALNSEGVYHSLEVLEGFEPFDKYRESLSTSEVLADDKLPFRCSVGEFADSEGNRYLMILNRDYLDARQFKLNLKKAFRVYEVSGEDGTQSVRNRSTKSLSLELAAGDAIFLRLQDAEEEAELLDYVLKK
ncbi:MAG: hypothetical protein J6J03_08455 [Tyzzerella sp.]|nr:hypothetical protein [Tyzzerella sp.]